MLRETRGALVASGAADGDASFEATAAISLPRACRPVPPRSSSKTADAPADLASMAVGFASALAFGRAIPPAPPTEDGLTAPAAWHPSRPVLATVDGEGQVLIHQDPARRSLGTPADANLAHSPSPPATTTALRHASHARARALAWRPRAGATLAVAGGDGVCLWSRDPGASGAVGDASSACADARKGGSTSAPNPSRHAWRVRRLPDERDDAPPVAEEDPFRAAGVRGTFFSFANAALAVSENVRAALAALASAVASPGMKFPLRETPPSTRRTSRLFFGRAVSAREGKSTFPTFPRVDSKPLPYDTCAWSPDGRLLVAGSKDRSGISAWEIATGKRVAVASDARGVASLTFSRCGEYLLAAHARSGFTVWETEGWRSAFWGTEGRAVTAVAWGPRGGATPGPGEKNSHGPGSEAPPRGATALVAAEGGGARLVAAHFSRGAPSLAAQVLPVDLPRAVPASGGDVGETTETDGKRSASPDVAHMSWDPSGRRLAVAFADAPGARESEKIGLFATRLAPVTRASLIGYVAAESSVSASRESGTAPFGNAGPARSALLSGPGGAAGCRAPGDDAEATTTLAACWEGGGVSFVPVFA